MTPDEMARLARTAVRLRPGQIGQRARLRAQRMAVERRVPLAGRWLLAGPDPASAVGWPAAFTPIDAALWRDWPGGAALSAGELSLLGVTRALAPAGKSGTPDWMSADWTMASAPLLWRFHLYYWDWAWGLDDGQQRAAFTSLWESWAMAVRPGHGHFWHPYPTALRAWSLCGLYSAMVRGDPIEGPFLGELAVHAGFLRRSLETDVGGNHLIKNLKALVGLAIFFADSALLQRALGLLRRQLAVQVLPDGGHFERAPAYHCQVLGDLIDIAGLLDAAGEAGPSQLPAAITAMRRWLGAVLTPVGEVPLLNDGFPVSRELLAAIRPAAPPAAALHLLPDTGLARASVGRWHLLADIGLPCPRELPAHAHADTLGCLVHLDAEPFLIDTCTSTYEAGAVREHERSTAAHNTLELDGADSTEVWGAFRAGRLARVTGLLVGTTRDAATGGDVVTIEAVHDGYRHLPGRPAHHRSWRLSADELRIEDTVTGRGRHAIAVRWHLAPNIALRLVPGGAVVTTKGGDFDVTITATARSATSTTFAASAASAASATSACAADLTAGEAEIGTSFGATVPAPVLTCVLQSELPVRISTVWRPIAPRPNPQEKPA
jgi:uncharacterized heparinase superfamily protein